MTLENKYNVSRETIQRMVNDGIIPTSVKNHYQIYDLYLQLKSECPECSIVSISERIADKTNESFENVRKVIYNIGKKS